MSVATMILGETGTGKTTSLRNLNPAETLLMQAVCAGYSTGCNDFRLTQKHVRDTKTDQAVLGLRCIS